jgi:Zn-finger protein/predicted metal-binding protein
MDMNDYLKKAKEFGFTQAVEMQDLFIECKPELRAYCNPRQCPNHEQNWVCPPGCGTLEECAKKVRGFNRGILLQSVSKLTPPVSPETYRELNRAHNLRFKKFIEFVKQDSVGILPLTSGGCVFCEQCGYPAPCIKPGVKMESLSAFGIDVGELCRIADVEYSFREDMVYYTALLLIKSQDGAGMKNPRQTNWRESEYSFFNHKSCEMFPCHKGIAPENFNCLFCYCPLYPADNCGGNFTRLSNGVKDCGGCAFPHERENYGAVTERVRK